MSLYNVLENQLEKDFCFLQRLQNRAEWLTQAFVHNCIGQFISIAHFCSTETYRRSCQAPCIWRSHSQSHSLTWHPNVIYPRGQSKTRYNTFGRNNWTLLLNVHQRYAKGACAVWTGLTANRALRNNKMISQASLPILHSWPGRTKTVQCDVSVHTVFSLPDSTTRVSVSACVGSDYSHFNVVYLLHSLFSLESSSACVDQLTYNDQPLVPRPLILLSY